MKNALLLVCITPLIVLLVSLPARSVPSEEFSTNPQGNLNTNNNPPDENNPPKFWDYYAPRPSKQLTWPEIQQIYAGLPTDTCGLTRRMAQLLNEHMSDHSYPDQRSMSIYMYTGNELVRRMQMQQVGSNSPASQCLSTWMGLFQAMSRVVANNSGVDRGAIRNALSSATANCIICGGDPRTWRPQSSGDSQPPLSANSDDNNQQNPFVNFTVFLAHWVDSVPSGTAHNNDALLMQFLTGKGADYQPHNDINHDEVLRAFVNSPAGDIVRKQYATFGYPAKTDKLNFGTIDAFFQTVAPSSHYVPGSRSVTGTMAGVDVPPVIDYRDWSNPATQIGGFGNPPKENKDYTFAKATGTRVNSSGAPDPNGKYVEYNIVNLAGRHSFLLHAAPDAPLGSTGPMRTIVQTLRWTEALPKPSVSGKYEYQAP